MSDDLDLNVKGSLIRKLINFLLLENRLPTFKLASTKRNNWFEQLVWNKNHTKTYRLTLQFLKSLKESNGPAESPNIVTEAYIKAYKIPSFR